MDILETLKLGNHPDLSRWGDGYVAMYCLREGGVAYDIAVNDPLDTRSVEKIVDFGGGADPALIRCLYQLCNGLWVADFGVYGLPSGPWGWQQPWDINVPNCFERPSSMPDDYLIVGTSFDHDGPDHILEMYHCITGDSRLAVVNKHNPSNIIRDYRSIYAWLTQEAERALGKTV